MKRRDFLVLSAAAALLPRVAHGRPPGAPLRVVFVSTGAPADMVRGVQFGAAEMAHTARLLRSALELVEVASMDAVPPPGGAGAAAVLCASGADAAALHAAGHLVLDLSDDERCSAALRLRVPRRALQHLAADGEAVEYWHPSLYRYGAEQLNERYARAHGSGLTSASWVGWMAVKAAWEAAQRTDGTRSAMVEYLTGENANLDGHKGEALRFDTATRWLVQPLYRVRGDSVTGTIPSDAAAAAAAKEAACAAR